MPFSRHFHSPLKSNVSPSVLPALIISPCILQKKVYDTSPTITSMDIPSISSIQNILNSNSSLSRFKNWLTAPFVCSSNAFLSSVTSSPLQYAEITSPPDVITVDEYPSSCSSFWVHPTTTTTKTTTNTKLTLFFIFCPFWQIRKKQPISGCFISTSYPSHRFQLPLSLCQIRIPMFPTPSFVPKITPISPYPQKKTAIM